MSRWLAIGALLVAIVALGWTTWIVTQPTYWLAGAYAEEGPRGDPGPRGSRGPIGQPGPVGPEASEAIADVSARVDELDVLLQELADTTSALDAEAALSDLQDQVDDIQAGIDDVEGRIDDICFEFSFSVDLLRDIWASACLPT